MWDRSDNRTDRPTVFPARIWRRAKSAIRFSAASSSCASKTIALRRDAVFVRGSRGSVRARVGERSRARDDAGDARAQTGDVALGAEVTVETRRREIVVVLVSVVAREGVRGDGGGR